MLFTAPNTSSRLETLDIVRVGQSLDVYRQGQAWAQLQNQNVHQPNALHIGTALPTDVRDYPIDATLKNLAWEQRKSNALELALQSFPERWRIPTISIVRSYNPNAERLRVLPEEADKRLNQMASLELGDAGLHWHRINQLKNGVICNDNPEAVVESVFEVFERHPDMPDSIDPAFTGCERTPPHTFQPSPFFPAPITQRGFEQWDRLKVLARLHRPVAVSLHQEGKTSIPLKGTARDKALASGWDQAVSALSAPPARAFFETGKPSGGIAELATGLYAAQQSVDLLDATQSYDLTQRLGDTGAASPFVGLALATMASYLNADSSMVVPLRRTDRATFIGISSPAPGKKPEDDPFGVKLRPQHTLVTDEPSPEFKAWHGQRIIDYQREQQRNAPRYRDPAVVAREQRMLDEFIAGLPNNGPLDPNKN